MNFSFFLTCNVAEFKTELAHLTDDEFILLLEFLNKNLDYLTMDRTDFDDYVKPYSEIKRIEKFGGYS